MEILVIDGQGGGVGKVLVEQLKRNFPEQTIIAVGTNSLATNNMMKGGPDLIATGENAVDFNCNAADIIVAPNGVLFENAMRGEVTKKMSDALSRNRGKTFLIPMAQCHFNIMGLRDAKMSEYIGEAIENVKRVICEKNTVR